MLSEFIGQFPEDQKEVAVQILSFSPYLQTQLTRHPEWVNNLLESRSYSNGELSVQVAAEIQSAQDEADLLVLTRRIRHRESVCIAWRDLVGYADLKETLAHTSELADALVSHTLGWWYQRLSQQYGTPHSADGVAQQLIVLGMGKLGGNELNFSSDIDLIFAFPENGVTKGGRKSLDNQQFFTRLGQKLINTLGKITAEGFAYRVDMRLRPFGDVGALALSFDAMEHYYQTHGREWERYALVKARVIAGSPLEGQKLLKRLKPFVYRRYLDFGAVEQLRDMKALIDREAQRKGKQNDIKLGAGGIREIEFCAQVFQLIRGGRIKKLQQTHLLATLKQLTDLSFLKAGDEQQLRTAYYFLRRCENRLQMWNDEQAHALPAEPQQLLALSQSMGYQSVESFQNALQQIRQQVNQIFKRVFVLEQAENQAADDEPNRLIWQHVDRQTYNINQLAQQGFQKAEQSCEQLRKLREGRLYNALTELARERLDRLIPLLIQTCALQKQPDLALERSLQVLQAIAQRSGYISLLADHSGALKQFIQLVHSSSRITAQLTQYPVLLDNLLDSRELYHPLNRDELDAALQEEISSASEDTEYVMECLRQFMHTQVLRVEAADISGALPLMVVSDQLSWIAEVILEQASHHAQKLVQQKYGEPHYIQDEQQHKASLAIVAYGKLGGLELGYGSDLDIVFLHDSCGTKQQTSGPKNLENPVYFARLAQKIIHILSTFTHDGRLYEVDTRLRPSGASGLLVSSLEAFSHYQNQKAWIWEHQALIRTRVITGSASLKKRFEALRHDILCQKRDPAELQHEVLAMRQKMWESIDGKDPSLLNIKKAPGGIVDIEFMVQYLILAHAHRYPQLTHWSDNIRQLESLQQCGLLTQEQANRLADIYRALRNAVHALALQEEKALVSKDQFLEERQYVRHCWSEVFSSQNSVTD